MQQEVQSGQTKIKSLEQNKGFTEKKEVVAEIKDKLEAFNQAQSEYENAKAVPKDAKEKKPGFIDKIITALGTSPETKLEKAKAKLKALAKKYEVEQPGKELTASEIQNLKAKLEAKQLLVDAHQRQINGLKEQLAKKEAKLHVTEDQLQNKVVELEKHKLKI